STRSCDRRAGLFDVVPIGLLRRCGPAPCRREGSSPGRRWRSPAPMIREHGPVLRSGESDGPGFRPPGPRLILTCGADREARRGESTVVWTALVLLAISAAPPTGDPPAPVAFNREIRPILSDHCYPCHGPDPSRRKAGLRFDLESSARADRDG